MSDHGTVDDLGRDALSPADRSAVLDAVARIGAARDLEEFAERACDHLLDLVPGVSASYNELDLLTGRTATTVRPTPEPGWFDRWGPVFVAHMHQNPAVSH